MPKFSLPPPRVLPVLPTRRTFGMSGPREMNEYNPGRSRHRPQQKCRRRSSATTRGRSYSRGDNFKSELGQTRLISTYSPIKPTLAMPHQILPSSPEPSHLSPQQLDPSPLTKSFTAFFVLPRLVSYNPQVCPPCPPGVAARVKSP